MTSDSLFLNFAREVAREHRLLIAEISAQSLEIDQKKDSSLVTNIDRALEEHFRNRVSERFPTHGVIGEEQGATKQSAEFRWVIDPIDGTEELACGLSLYGSIIALYENNTCVVALIDHPALDVCYYAMRGHSTYRNDVPVKLQNTALSELPRFGIASRSNFLRTGDEGNVFEGLTKRFPNVRAFHSCYAHTAAVDGGLDVMVEWNVNFWDIAATRLLVEEAGGKYHPLPMRETREKGSLYSAVFGKPKFVGEAVEYLQSVGFSSLP